MTCWAALSGVLSSCSRLQLPAVALTSSSRCLLPQAPGGRFTGCWLSCCGTATLPHSVSAAQFFSAVRLQ